MKYTLIHLLILVLGFQCLGQEQLQMVVGYQPNYNYTITQKQIFHNKVHYIGSVEFLQELNNNGVANPTITTDTTIIKSISKSGIETEGVFPVEMEVMESSNPTLSVGTKFFGVSKDGKIRVDSILSSTISNEIKQSVLSAVESLLNQTQLSERTIKVGESFEQTTPFSMPIADATFVMEIISTYTLSRVDNGFGYFDLEQVYKVNSSSKDYEMEMEGKGKGNLTLDIENQFFTKYFLETDLNATIDLELFKLEMLSKSVVDQKVEVKKASR